MIPRRRTYRDAASRWAGVGPYYAMFPSAFSDDVVLQYTRPGEVVLDPFAGRGTAVFSAVTLSRLAIGIEINPVGYVYAKTKLGPAKREKVERRVNEIGSHSSQFKKKATYMPHFFHRCFSHRVRSFLLAARSELNWRQNKVDRTLMALLLVYLHGKRGQALSNQMRQTKSMSPQYAVRWWKDHDLDPPDIDPIGFIKSRLAWRYAKGIPESSNSHMYLGNSIEVLGRLHQRTQRGLLTKANLLFTSPPYHAVTNYHYDQWIRLWLLGGQPDALSNGKSGEKFTSREGYRKLLERVFSKAAKIIEEDATIYVRTDGRDFTHRTTAAVLRKVFSGKRFTEICRPLLGSSQTHLFGTASTPIEKSGEVDLVLTP